MESNKIHQHESHRDYAKWELAKRRASFKPHLASYLIINSFLWGIWFFTGSENYNGRLPWPVWPTAGWGIGLLFHYLGAYVYSSGDAVEREYEKLTKSKNNF